MNKKNSFQIDITKIMSWIFMAIFALTFLGTIKRYIVNDILIVLFSIIPIFIGRRNILIYTFKNYVFIVLFFLYGLITVALTEGGIGGIYTIVSGIPVFLACREIKFSKVQCYIMTIVVTLTATYWIINSDSYYEKYMMSVLAGKPITNSNGVGWYITYSVILYFIFLDGCKSKLLKLSRWGFIALGIWGTYNVRSRMSFVLYVVFIIGYIIINNFESKREICIKAFFTMAIVSEVVFPFIYLKLYSFRFGSKYKFANVEEKGIYSGREDIWQRALNSFDSIGDWIFGVGSKNNFWVGHVLNMHNNFMNLLVVVGIAGCVFYYIFLYRLIISNNNFEKRSKFQYLMLLYFIGILFQGISDITIFYNGTLVMVYLPLGLAFNSRFNKEEVKE